MPPATEIEPTVAITARLFRGFGDASRLSILQALRDGPCTVGELVDATGLSQPNVSNHLRCLADCDLVISERDGRFVRYELSDPRVGDLIDLGEELLADVAHGVQACTRYDIEAGQEKT